MKLRQWENKFHVIVNANSIAKHVIQNKNGTIKHVNVNEQNITIEKHYSWNPSICICENSKYLKSVVDTSVTKCDTIVIVLNNLSTKKTKSITTNVTSTALINWHR